MGDFELKTLVNLEELSEKAIFANLGIFDLLGDPLKSFVRKLCKSLDCNEQPVIKGTVHPSAVVEGQVYVAEGAVIGPHAYVIGPTYIAPGAEVRHSAFIRGTAYIGPNAVVGHTTEVKGSVFMDDAKAGHFAYVGDSVLGRDVNLGAGTKLANLKLKRNEVRYKDPVSGKLENSGLRKFGALLGDGAQTGCNAVISPGSILMPGKLVSPCQHFHGTMV